MDTGSLHRKIARVKYPTSYVIMARVTEISDREALCREIDTVYYSIEVGYENS